MKSVQSYKAVSLLALSLLAIGLSAGLASAQQYVGKVKFPVKTLWGNAVLPAGDYTLMLDPSVPNFVTIRRGDKSLALIPTTGGTEQDTTIVNSELLGIRSGGVLRISMLRLAEFHLALAYPKPKSEPRYLAESGPRLIQRIAVTRSGK
jgi:hypothetical protein